MYATANNKNQSSFEKKRVGSNTKIRNKQWVILIDTKARETKKSSNQLNLLHTPKEEKVEKM